MDETVDVQEEPLDHLDDVPIAPIVPVHQEIIEKPAEVLTIEVGTKAYEPHTSPKDIAMLPESPRKLGPDAEEKKAPKHAVMGDLLIRKSGSKIRIPHKMKGLKSFF